VYTLYGATHKKKLYGTVMGTPILVKHGKDERKDERRAAIVDIAHAAFLADGYAATSMSTIAAKVGGSKATLYNYFSSKEELFIAVVSRKCEQMQSLLYDAQVESGDFRSALQNFGEHFIALVLQEESVATYRMVMAECERFPELGRVFYDTGMKQGRARLGEYFEEAIAAGDLRNCDSVLMANYFFDLCMSGIHTRKLWNVQPPLSPKGIHDNVARAIAVFMAAFGTKDDSRDEVVRLCQPG
jgi:TetR/AcrR family transcriptional regulator, mexJK operon transcriptional repressor